MDIDDPDLTAALELSIQQPSLPPPKDKCFKCNKKIMLVEQITNKCRCGNVFCVSHKLLHDCNFNYHEHAKNIIEKNNQKI